MKYRYAGNEMGVPGLPHEISDEEAKALGVESILNEAIENGSYELIAASKVLPTGKNKKSEVNNG